jgi:hypothetical protein
MSQHDYNIANDSGANVRSDINSALGAIQSQNSGSSYPTDTVAHMVAANTTKGYYGRRNAADSAWIPFAPGSSTMVQAKSADYTLVEGDFATLIDYTSGTKTLTLPAVATAGDGFWFDLRNSGTGVITVDGDGSETIDGVTTITFYPGDSGRLWCNGSVWKTVGRGSAVQILTAEKTIDLTNVVSGGAVSDTITVTGAAVGDPVSLGISPAAFNNQLFFQAYVSAADTVTITATSNSGSSIDPSSGTFRVAVFHF